MPRVSDSVEKAAAKAMIEATTKRRQMVQYYKEEEKVDMYLSPVYRPHFGKVMKVTINGVSIYFPVDGSTNSIPRTFADEITSRRMKVDEIIIKQKKMADVAVNVDSATPGDLKFF